MTRKELHNYMKARKALVDLLDNQLLSPRGNVHAIIEAALEDLDKKYAEMHSRDSQAVEAAEADYVALFRDSRSEALVFI